MTEHFKAVLLSQLRAALRMHTDCIERCPAEHWNNPVNPVAKYPFWLVAYHTLCFVDLYLSPGEAVWQPRTGEGGFHPAGWAELDEEYPSRVFTQAELIRYGALCHEMLPRSLASETAQTLTGPSGFSRLPFSRAELHLCNLRHIQHHTGAMGAFLRRVGVSLNWVKQGAGPS